MAKSKINYDIKRRPDNAPSVFIKAKKVNFVPKSYRFTNEDLIELQHIVNRLNEECRSRITHTKVLQILIHFCKKVPSKTLMTALKEMV